LTDLSSSDIKDMNTLLIDLENAGHEMQDIVTGQLLFCIYVLKYKVYLIKYF